MGLRAAGAGAVAMDAGPFPQGSKESSLAAHRLPAPLGFCVQGPCNPCLVQGPRYATCPHEPVLWRGENIQVPEGHRGLLPPQGDAVLAEIRGGVGVGWGRPGPWCGQSLDAEGPGVAGEGGEGSLVWL